MKKYLFFIAAALITASAGAKAPQTPPVRNVILMIGDGMGLAQVHLGMSGTKEPMAITRAQYIGLITTHSANNSVTDSAAGGTALACGVKTDNGTVGMDPQGNTVTNLTERARDKGLATAIVATKDITDATPATFTVHSKKRHLEDEIAYAQATSGFDVFIGGGRANFEKRADGINLSDSLRARGYRVVYTIDALDSVAKTNGKIFAMLADKHQPKAPSRANMLPRATADVLEMFRKSSPKGFFAMIEGSQIDSGGHSKDAEVMYNEVIDFDAAVRVAFDFADRNPGTLVVVTADHETGGLTFPSKSEDFLLSDQGLKLNFSVGGHTGIMVPVYAYGTGASAFSTFMDNTDIPKKIAALLNLKW